MKVPRESRYYISNSAAHAFLIANNIHSLPLNPLELAKKNNWNPVTVGHCAKELLCDREAVIKSNDGYTMRCYDAYRIIYNEQIDTPARISWTIMHEIGHIVLGHLVDFEQTSLYRSSPGAALGLTEAEYDILESEADAFAAEVLAPLPLLVILKIQSAEEIMTLFKLSRKAATYRFDNLCALRRSGVDPAVYAFFSHQFRPFITDYYNIKDRGL